MSELPISSECHPSRPAKKGAAQRTLTVVQGFIKADARVPKEVVLPSPVEREVARILEQRRDYPVVDAIEALSNFSQPGLLQTDNKNVEAQMLSKQASN